MQLAGRTLELVVNAAPAEPGVLDHHHTRVDVPLRLPDEQEVEAARQTLARVDAGEPVDAWTTMWAHGRTLAHDRLAGRTHEALEVQALRLDDLAIVTHPCEMYFQFGLDLKRPSPAAMTAIADVTNAYSGYCPTYGAYLGGGYSGDALYWTRLAPEAGYRLVDEAARVLHGMWGG